MTGGYRGISWIKSMSGWESMQAWRERRQVMAQQYLSDGAAISNAFANASINLSSGSAALAAKAATKRIQAETKAKFDELSKIDITI
jgi:hypothetical protein